MAERESGVRLYTHPLKPKNPCGGWGCRLLSSTAEHGLPDTEHGTDHGTPVARALNRLTARGVAAAKPGYHADGGGLFLRVSDSLSRSWVFRYSRNKRPREMGLGSALTVTLQEAREKAHQQRRLLANGKDPIDERKRAQDALPTFGACADALITSLRPGWRNDEQEAQWRQSLAAYGPSPTAPVAEIDTAAVIACLSPIWQTKTETATRVRARIERVLDWAKVSGLRDGENPARWRGHLDKLLPRPSKLKRNKHHAAMPFADLPAFMTHLRERDGIARRALEFTILTAARTDEVVGSAWTEFDLNSGVWTVPGHRMKAGVEHVVPLTTEAINILQALSRDGAPFPLSENGMLSLLQKSMGRPYTVHGFRSSFSDWASETSTFPREVIEMSLAHTIKDKAEAAYRRGKLLEKRRRLMESWAAFLGGYSPPSPSI